jgi:hypothetical protein
MSSARQALNPDLEPTARNTSLDQRSVTQAAVGASFFEYSRYAGMVDGDGRIKFHGAIPNTLRASSSC